MRVDDNDSLKVKDLVYSSLVRSSNNTIETLVRASGMERDKFMSKMNDSAVLWGASSTVFVEPTGLAPSNHTTVRDFSKILTNIFTNSVITEASITQDYSFITNSTGLHRVINTNRLLKYITYPVLGSKTGYLDEAGFCLAMKAKIGNQKNVILVLLGSDDRMGSYQDAEKLIKYSDRKLK